VTTRVAGWLRLGLAAAVLVGCATMATGQETKAAPQQEQPKTASQEKDQLPASYPRLEDFGLKAEHYDAKEREPYNRAVDKWFEPPPADQPQPKIACDEPNAPVCTLWKGQDFRSSWEIRNDGAATLRISVLTSCKAYVRGPTVREIAPGGRSIIEVEVRWCRVGQSSDHVQVRTNDRVTPKLTLAAETNVLSALRSADQRYGWWRVDFGKLPRDAGPQTKSIVFERGNGGPLDVKLLGIAPPRGRESDVPPDNVEAAVRMLEPGERYAVDITIKPPWPGPISGRVRVSTGVSEQPEDEIGFSAIVPPRVMFTCEPPTLPRVRTETRTMKLWPKWSADQPGGHIVAVDSDVPGMHARIKEEGGTTFILVVIGTDCTAPLPARPHLLTVRTNDPDAAEVKVQIRFEH
jgi:hypothetical protein